MNSKILKLDAPYNIIYAGGRVGRHIATMTVWEDNDMGIYDARQYAMIDEGGELAAAIIADSVTRLVPGVISDDQSALSDSFQDGLLSAPIYTRPADYKGWKVPDILLSGNEAKIKNWEMEQALERTKRLRPDLLK